MKFAVVILAAGASKRMGQPKLLLPWQGTTIIGHLLDQWQALGAESIVIVCSKDNAPLLQAIQQAGNPTVQTIFNPQPERGMFSSIQCAAHWDGWSSGLTHWAISLGDQPLVRLDTLQQLLAYAAAHPEDVCQPARAGHGRHPVILPRQVFARLQKSDAADLKQFLGQDGVQPAQRESDDAGLDLDLDDPADYEKALRLAAGRGGLPETLQAG